MLTHQLLQLKRRLFFVANFIFDKFAVQYWELFQILVFWHFVHLQLLDQAATLALSLNFLVSFLFKLLYHGVEALEPEVLLDKRIYLHIVNLLHHSINY